MKLTARDFSTSADGKSLKYIGRSHSITPADIVEYIAANHVDILIDLPAGSSVAELLEEILRPPGAAEMFRKRYGPEVPMEGTEYWIIKQITAFWAANQMSTVFSILYSLPTHYAVLITTRLAMSDMPDTQSERFLQEVVGITPSLNTEEFQSVVAVVQSARKNLGVGAAQNE